LKIAQIFIDQKNKRLDRPFDYLVPDTACPGMRTVQRFSGESRVTKGFIAGISESSDYQGDLKAVDRVLDREPVLTQEQIQLCLKLKQSCFCLFWEALAFFTAWTPLRRKAKGLEPYRLEDEVWLTLREEPERTGAVQEEIIQLLKKHDWSYLKLREIMPNVRPSLKSLHDKGAVEKYSRKPAILSPPPQIPGDFAEDLRFDPFSGDSKETAGPVYIEAGQDRELDLLIRSFIRRDRPLLIIAPSVEDAARLADSIAASTAITPVQYHGRLSASERWACVHNFQAGSTMVMTATPAGLFIPFGNSSDRKAPLILVTDAGSERYHLPGRLSLDSVRTAEALAVQTGAQLVLTDRMPSVLSRYKTDGNRKWTDKTTEFQACLKPDVEYPDQESEPDCTATVVRMDRELRNGNTGILSRKLSESIRHSLADGKKTVLLLNRRGYVRHVFCRNCGYSFTCPDCGIALQTDKSGRFLYCRDCGYKMPRPQSCPQCGSSQIRESGMGIEKAAELVSRSFPEARVGIYPETEEADILIGTQALLGKRSFSGTGTAAALLIDLDTGFPDYRADERAFRLYRKFFRRVSETQQPDRIIQTYSGDSETVRAAAGSPEIFLPAQAEYRRLMQLPPYAELFVFTLTAQDPETARRESGILNSRLTSLCTAKGIDARILPVFRLSGHAGSCRFTVRSNDPQFRKFLHRLYKDGEIEALLSRVSININPPNIL
jgi:primosomal protein N' (replication factor Y)